MNQFSDSILSLRRRSVWEAADSGLILWRNSFAHSIIVFAVPLWITACVLRLVPIESPYISYFVIWWLKPFFSRLVLHVVSQRFFSAPSPGSFKECLSSFWELRRGLLGDLLWRRFSPLRSACMPIRILERTSRRQYSLRKETLMTGGIKFCSLVTIFGLALEAVLLGGEIVFVIMVSEQFFPAALTYLQNNREVTEIIIFCAFCFNYILVETLYVCMGFGLYINSRVEVEGWDLQLLFQKLAAVKTTARKVSVKTSAKAVLLFCFFLVFSQVSYADPHDDETASKEPASVEYFPENFPVVSDEAKGELEKILASDDFGGRKETWGIRLKEGREQEEKPQIDLSPLLKKIREMFGYMVRLLAVVAIIVFLIFAFFWLKKNRKKLLSKLRMGQTTDQYGLSGSNADKRVYSPQSPEALFVMAEDFFSRGNLREAWAACLSGCIGACKKYRFLSFPDDATEYICLDIMRKALPDEADGFKALVQSWILIAYGGKVPEQDAFRKSIAYGRSLMTVKDGNCEA